MEQTHALGRRKAAVARVYLTAGTGNVTVNDRPIESYFPLDSLRYVVNQPFEVTGTLGQFDVKITIKGGGIKGQAEAIRLGISRALCEVNKEAYRPALKAAGFLTRDAREVERKKPGQPTLVISLFYGTAVVVKPSRRWLPCCGKGRRPDNRYSALMKRDPGQGTVYKKQRNKNVTHKFPRIA